MKFVLVGKHEGKRIVKWPHVFLWSALVVLAACLAALLLLISTDQRSKSFIEALFAWVAGVLIFCVGLPLIRRLRMPLEQLPAVDSPRDSHTAFGRFIRWLFSWRGVRAAFFAAACLITAIALLYAEENWRGKREWEKYKREWEARGERFDFANFIPPPVPDDQNFAMTPLLRPLFDYDRALVSTWRDSNGFHRASAIGVFRPHFKPPEFADWTKGEFTNLKVWQDYVRRTNSPPVTGGEDLRKRYRLASDTPGSKNQPPPPNYWPVPDEPQTPAEDVLLALSRFDSELNELRAASVRPYSRFPIHYLEIGDGGAFLAHLSVLKKVSQLLQLRGTAELELKKTEAAFDDAMLILFLAHSVESEPFVISHLVRIAMIDVALQLIWEGLLAHLWTDKHLEQFQQVFAKLDLLFAHPRLSRAALALENSLIDLIPARPETFFTPDGFSNTAFSSKPPTFLIRLTPRGWFYQNKLSASRFFLEKVVPLCDPKQQRVYPALSRANSTFLENLPVRPENFATKRLTVFISPSRFARAQTHIDLARLACGLERYNIAHGHFPETLDALVPRFVMQLPRDVIDGQPLKYHRTEDGQFILYSVGWNEKDDGGAYPSILKQESNSFGDWLKDEVEEGDWVWRYPPKNPEPKAERSREFLNAAIRLKEVKTASITHGR